MAIFKKFNKTENRDIYWIDYYDENGIRRRESTGSGSHSFAKEFHTKKLDAVAHRRKLPERYIPKVNFADFVDNEYLPIHAKGSKYEANIRGICNKLIIYFGDRFLHEINSRIIEIYKKDRVVKVADNTINNELNTLNGIFTKAIEWGKASINPVHNVKRFRIKERKRILEQW